MVGLIRENFIFYDTNCWSNKRDFFIPVIPMVGLIREMFISVTSLVGLIGIIQSNITDYTFIKIV